MNDVEISQFLFRDREFTNIAINENGEYRLPSTILAKPICASALDVVSILVDRDESCFVLQPIGNVVTTELLTEDVRLEIYPKVCFDALNLLLQWSSHPAEALPGVSLPVGFEKQTGFFDVFVGRFLATLEDIVRNGWCPRIVNRERFSESPAGAIDPIRSVEHLLTRLEVGFFQHSDEQDFNGTANRILRTTLVFLARSGRHLSTSNYLAAREVLGDMPSCQAYANTREAVTLCDDLLTTRSMDSGRDYYYAALTASKPILEAISRMQGGSVEDEHIPIRISMPLTFESALRNVTAARLDRQFVVSKGKDKRLYSSSEPDAFNPVLEPDIVITRLGNALDVVAVFDVKYKGRPTASDHHQLAAYMFGYKATFGGFLTVAGDGNPGLVSTASTSEGEEIVEYSIDTGNLSASIGAYLDWLSLKLQSRD